MATCARCGDYAPVDLCNYHRKKRAELLRNRGEFDDVDADPARARLRALRGRGWGWTQLERAAGQRYRFLIALYDGTQTTIRRDKERRLLAIEPTWQYTNVIIPSAGTRRRLRALMCQGWPQEIVTKRTGIPKATLTHVQSRRAATVRACNAAAIAAVFAELAYTRGPSGRSRARAKALGALPAAAWDEDAIDDPDARPLRARQWKRYTGPVKRIDPEELAGLVKGGRSLELIAEDLGFTVAALKESLTAYRARQRRSQQEKKEAA